MDKENILKVLNAIRDECWDTGKCKNCRFACTYYVSHDGIIETRYACVLNEAPYRWQLETMEGFYDGEES